jgi:hypothetical protein
MELPQWKPAVDWPSGASQPQGLRQGPTVRSPIGHVERPAWAGWGFCLPAGALRQSIRREAVRPLRHKNRSCLPHVGLFRSRGAVRARPSRRPEIWNSVREKTWPGHSLAPPGPSAGSRGLLYVPKAEKSKAGMIPNSPEHPRQCPTRGRKRLCNAAIEAPDAGALRAPLRGRTHARGGGSDWHASNNGPRGGSGWETR